eukprot:5341098-Pleurochrysis_carterae.AAC.7
MIGPYDCNSLINTSFDTRSHFIVIDAGGLDNDNYLLFFGDYPRPSTYGTGNRWSGLNSLIRIRLVLPERSTPIVAHLAVKACHGLFQAIEKSKGESKTYGAGITHG